MALVVALGAVSAGTSSTGLGADRGFSLAEANPASKLTVIDRAALDACRATYLVDALRTLADFHVARAGAWGAPVLIEARGASARELAILVDGVPFNSPASGLAPLGHLLTEAVERVELLDGADSSVVGSNSMGGTVNIVMRRGAEAGAAVEASAGAHARVGGGSTVAAKIGDVAFVFSGGVASSDGPAPAGENLSGEAYLHASLPVTTIADVEFALLHLDGRRGLDTQVAGEGDTLAALNFDLDLFDDHVTNTLAISYLDGSRRLLAGPSPPGPTETDSLAGAAQLDAGRIDVAWRGRVRVTPFASLRLGYEHRDENAEAVFSDERPRLDSNAVTNAFMAQIALEFGRSVIRFDDRLVAELGARVDKHEVVGNAVSARFAGRYDLNQGLSFRAVYATGQRLPTMGELDTFAREERDFFHETAAGVDLGVEARSADRRLSLDGAWFHTSLKRLLGDLAGGEPFDYAAQGFHVDLAFLPREHLRVAGRYAYLHMDRAAPRGPLAPTHRVGLDLTLDHGDFAIDGGTSFVSGPFASRDTELRGEGYVLADVTASHAWQRSWGTATAFARIDNLFDDAHDEVPGVPAPGISAVIGLRIEAAPAKPRPQP